jgi:GT2 family glycosyltransferase
MEKTKANDKIDLSIVIITYIARKYIEDCLKSLYSHKSNLNFEVIVVDNNSRDGTSEFVKEHYPQVRLRTLPKNLGTAGGNNKGIGISKGEFILLLNSDTIVFDYFLDAMVEVFRKRPEVGMVGCRILNDDMTLQSSMCHFHTLLNVFTRIYPLHYFLPKDKWRGLHRYHKSAYEKETEADWVTGACVMVRKSIIKEIGLKDERYFFYNDDTDWCFQAKKKGYKVMYTPKGSIIHFGGKSTEKTPVFFMEDAYKSQMYFFKKNYSLFRFWLLKIIIFPKLLVGIFAVLFCPLFWKKSPFKRIATYLRLIKYLFFV